MNCRMDTQIQMVAHEDIDEGFLTRVRLWINEVLEVAEFLSPPPLLCITVWKTMEEFQAFCKREKEELGIVTGEETDFLATHDAWRGYPRIHVCEERLTGIPSVIIQGVIHHEISHALHHGTLEFYTFRFSNRLQEAGLFCGFDLFLLQQSVYLLSVAIKDREVIQWLAKIGLGFSQQALLKHLISDTEEERRIWEVVQDSPPLRKIAFATFLKTLLPIEALVSAGIEEAQALRNQWNEAYAWLSEREQEALSLLARSIMNQERKTFQERLEQAVLRLITEPSV
jgi:hypothetical protein